jgi:circadian clock protein KaiC
LMGTPGSGKTLLGLHYLQQGATVGEKGLYFGFYERPLRLIQKAGRMGIDIQQHVDSGRLVLQWHSGLDQPIDYLAQQLIETIRANTIQRLFIDGVNGFMRSASETHRIGAFFTGLSNALRRMGVTVLISLEMQRLAGTEIDVPINGISSISDNLIMLRYVELNSQLYRLISVIKTRDSSYDSAIREFSITDAGITVADTFASAEAVLTGIARPRSDRD